MTKTILYAILLSTACQASAATLYRWIEPDGSITFSPEPPTTGVEFETVETGAGAKSANLEANRASQLAANTPSQPTQALDLAAAAQAELPVTKLQPPADLDLPAQGLSYAPGVGNTAQNTIVKGDADIAPAAALPPQSRDVVGSTQKHDQCQDLRKRVVSLEQRLRLELSPDEVDNTVVAIVRYQDSFDQFCG